MMGFPHYKQPDEMDCGPACLRIVAKHYGKTIPLPKLRQLTNTTRLGSSLFGLSEAAENIGFRTLGVKVTYDKLQEETPFPCIAHWNQNHFVVVYKIRKDTVYVSDPAHGLLTYSKNEFLRFWQSDHQEGIVLLLEPTPAFYSDEDEGLAKENKKKQGFTFLFHYLFRYQKLIVQLLIGLTAGSLLQLILPFLTQSIVDIGVQNQDMKFVYLILLAQLMLFFGRTTIEIIRSWILLHISSRINISLVSDFFVKLMKLPISFFDVKMTGDLMQRIGDHHRIENFLTSTSLNVLFSLINLIIFSFVLAFYSLSIFSVFLLGSILYFGWIIFFLRRREDLDYKRFSQNSRNQSKVMELIAGMQEIKLNNAERRKRWQWESIQVRLFRTSIKSLSLEQTQNVGSGLINEGKNIFITFLSAKLVIDGKITLGMMLSVSYIIGQLNGPILQLVTFVQGLQDARLSLERLAEIHNREDEENPGDERITETERPGSLQLSNVSFQYPGASDAVLKDLDLLIPVHKITAIVGSSGSGKTTLLKLLLKFYDPSSGLIKMGPHDMNHLSARLWRSKCGVVMQDGYIFSDTIAGNIALGEETVDKARLKQAVHIANIGELVESLPLGYNTRIGMEGIGLSGGQKQRILIARAVYKNPDYLFFDEATSALDSNNEKTILNNLQEFFRGKTVVVIAHRLSTVKNADQIVVLNKGRITEVGTHAGLSARRCEYYELVKNQLELGS
jgi:ATP-binding cassette subfamily B protein